MFTLFTLFTLLSFLNCRLLLKARAFQGVNHVNCIRLRMLREGSMKRRHALTLFLLQLSRSVSLVQLAPLRATSRSRLAVSRAAAPRLGLDVPEASSVAELLDLLSQLPVADSSRRMARVSVVPLPPNYEASPLSPERVRARARTLLAAPVSPEQRQAMLAELASEALAAQRPHSALLVFEMAERRAAKQRAQGKSGGVLGRELLRVGLVALARLRRREAYEALLARAQGEWGLELAEEPALLSAAMRAVADAGWAQHALAINASLADAALSPSAAALNALLELRLRSSDGDGAIDGYLAMRRGYGGSPPPDAASHALATRAAAARKTGWGGLRNLLRRKWFAVPWGTASANAALCSFAETGNLRGAAGAAAQMVHDQLPLTAVGAGGVLRHASLARKPHEALLSFGLLRRTATAGTGAVDGGGAASSGGGGGNSDGGGSGALDAAAYLHYLPFVRPSGRLSYLERAVEDCRDDGRGADHALLLAAVALQLATTEGEAARAARLLTWLHDEGFDLLRLDEGLRRDADEAGGGGGGGGGGGRGKLKAEPSTRG